MVTSICYLYMDHILLRRTRSKHLAFTIMLEKAVVLLSVLVSGLSQCQNGWIRYEESCYHFSHDTETFIDALAVCRELGGYLTEVTTAHENSFVENNVILFKRGDFWIGGSDWASEGDWIWVKSKMPLNESYTNWLPGQPDNTLSDENCLEIMNSNGFIGNWNDDMCHNFQHYVCESSVEVQPMVG